MSSQKNKILRSVFETRDVIESSITSEVFKELGTESRETVEQVMRSIKGVLYQQMDSLVSRIEKDL
jgi:hypothetical protein